MLLPLVVDGMPLNTMWLMLLPLLIFPLADVIAIGG